MTRRDSHEPPLLHVHAQDMWHEPCYIVGNRSGLIALRLAIEQALKSGNGHADAMAADGEEYMVYVQRNHEPWQSESWQLAAVPYTDEAAREKRENARWPEEEGGR